MKNRRHFLKSSFAASIAYPLPLRSGAFAAGLVKPLRIGIITDIHKDIIHDADERLKAFIDTMNAEKVDAILQMGDFCMPKPGNKSFVDLFNTFVGPKFHVLGNHDTDGGFKREQVMSFWNMNERYYSFNLGGFHFIILDSNDRPSGFKKGYPSHLAADQVEWLRADLEKTRLNTFIFSHHSLERPGCIDNQKEVRALLEAAKTTDSKRKVAACLNGHWHIDHTRVLNGIPYHHINSASYYWVGRKYRHECLTPELSIKFPAVALTTPYTQPLYTVLEIDGNAGSYSIRGAKSDWLGPSPASLGFTSETVAPQSIRPEITGTRGTLSQ